MSADETLIPLRERGWPQSRGLLLLGMTAEIQAFCDCRHRTNRGEQNGCPECVVHLVELQKLVTKFQIALRNGDFIRPTSELTPQQYP